ncbi:MAG: hypothetical protein M1423_07570, partial [Acidobacteria bacterium]|nr:hypothetical protein [Acidobacteriota bacterium]
NKAEKLLKTKDRPLKTNRNKPKNKAEKLLKTRTCGKNKAKNKATDLVENKWSSKKQTENKPEKLRLNLACFTTLLQCQRALCAAA